MTDDRSAGARAVRRVLFLVDPSRRSGGTSLLFNPVLVKELRTRKFGRAHWTLRLIAGAAVLSLGLSYVAAAGALGLGLDVIGGALVLLQSVLLLLFAPSLGSGLISAEREGGTWQLLRTTPLSAGAILRGKLIERGLAGGAAVMCDAPRLSRHGVRETRDDQPGRQGDWSLSRSWPRSRSWSVRLRAASFAQRRSRQPCPTWSSPVCASRRS